MLDIVTRAEWGARKPTSITTTTWAKRIGVAVHYSQGSPTNTPRDLQNYAMDSLGYSDTHYNFLVNRDGIAYEGRGWLVVGAHAANQNTPWIGVCFIGRDADVTDAAKATIRALYDEACRLSGRTLQYSGHGQLPGQSTDCPGANLRGWVATGMPYPNGEGDEMYEQADRNTAHADTWRLLTILEGRPAAEYQLTGEPAPRSEPNRLKEQLDRIEAKAVPQPAPIDQAALNAAVAAAISDPAVLAAIAKAVVAETARELTD
jgi:hypothetical protein